MVEEMNDWPVDCYTEDLIKRAAFRIADDVRFNDYTAIADLLEQIPAGYLEDFLSEDERNDLREFWNMDVPTEFYKPERG